MMQYQTRRKAAGEAVAQAKQSRRALAPGLCALPAEMRGRQMDLPGAIREKMENSFGADLSGVQLYESQAVADAGAEAMTMGSKIGFAPGKLDFASSSGQALLGHEISHVVSQARGEVTGSGFRNDYALEARADREGAMAAAGEHVYTGPVTPLSVSSTAQAAGPMQAKKKKDMEISEPTLVSHESIAKNGDKYAIAKDGKVSGTVNYYTPESAALGMLVNHASDEEMRSKEMRGAVLDDYSKNFGTRLKSYDNVEKKDSFSAMRDNYNGERKSYEKLMQANLPKGVVENLSNNYTPDTLDDAFDYVGGAVMGDAAMRDILQTGQKTFKQSKHYQDDSETSAMAMNFLMLRGIGPQLAQHSKNEQEKYAEKAFRKEKGRDMDVEKNRSDYAESVRLKGEAGQKGIGANALKMMSRMQKAVNDNAEFQTKGSRRFRGLLNNG